MHQRFMKQYILGFLHLLFPYYCVHCDHQLYGFENVLCESCSAMLPRTEFNFKSGNPVERIFWGRVQLEMASSFLTFSKKGIVQKLMFELKYNGEIQVGRKLGMLFAQDILRLEAPPRFDIILPVPLHRIKLRKRGFNQCEAIAEGMSNTLGIPYSSDNLLRTVNNPTQTSRNRMDRWDNVDSIFKIAEADTLEGKHILLVDDVVTTGATLESACLALLSIPDIRISIVTLAFPE